MPLAASVPGASARTRTEREWLSLRLMRSQPWPTHPAVVAGLTSADLLISTAWPYLTLGVTLGPLRAGETFEAVAADYGVSEKDLRTALDAIAA